MRRANIPGTLEGRASHNRLIGITERRRLRLCAAGFIVLPGRQRRSLVSGRITRLKHTTLSPPVIA